MKDIQKQLNATTAIATSIIMGVSALVMFLFLPLFVGALTDTLTIPKSQLSFLTSADLLGLGIGSFLGVFWVNKVNWKWSAVIALVLIIACNLLSISQLENPNLLIALRLISGLGQGSILALYSVHVAQTINPEKIYGYFLATQTIVAALGLFLLPQFIETLGAIAIIQAQTLLVVIALIMVFLWMPQKGLLQENEATTPSINFTYSGLGLLGLLLFFIAQGGVWAFMERIGNSFEMSPAYIGRTLSLAMIGAFFGAMAAAALGTKWGRKLPLIVTVVGQPLSLLLLFSDLGNIGFLVAVVIFVFFWNFGLPYIIGILIGIDPSGRTVIGANPVFALGASIAPILIAYFISDNGFTPVGYVGSIALGLSVFLLLGLERKIE